VIQKNYPSKASELNFIYNFVMKSLGEEFSPNHKLSAPISNLLINPVEDPGFGKLLQDRQSIEEAKQANLHWYDFGAKAIFTANKQAKKFFIELETLKEYHSLTQKCALNRTDYNLFKENVSLRCGCVLHLNCIANYLLLKYPSTSYPTCPACSHFPDRKNYFI